MSHPFSPPADAVPTEPGWPVSRHLKPLEARRTATLVALAAVAFFRLTESALLTAIVLMLPFQRVTWDGLLAQIYGAPEPDPTLLALATAHAMASLAFLVALVAAAVAWSMWTWRASKNLHTLAKNNRAPTPAFSPGWSVAFWFVPLANFVVPLLVHRDLLAKSDPERPRRGWVVVLWWGVWFLAWLLTSSVDRSTLDYPDLLAFTALLHSLMLSIATALGAWVVWATTRRQQDLINRVKDEEVQAGVIPVDGH